MLTTIWICTHEWSLICIRATALTFETCHHALSWASSFARSSTRAQLAVPALRKTDAHAGDRVGRREPCLADGFRRDRALDALLDLGVERRHVGAACPLRDPGHPGILAYGSHCVAGRGGGQRGSSSRAISRRACVRALPSRRAVDGLVEPRARAGRVRQRDRDRVVDEVALADALGKGPGADDRAGGETADGDHERGSEQSQLLAAPGAAEPLLGGRRRAVAAPARSPRVAAGHRGAVEGGVEASPRRARASAAACGRPGRATGAPSAPSTIPGACP